MTTTLLQWNVIKTIDNDIHKPLRVLGHDNHATTMECN